MQATSQPKKTYTYEELCNEIVTKMDSFVTTINENPGKLYKLDEFNFLYIKKKLAELLEKNKQLSFSNSLVDSFKGSATNAISDLNDAIDTLLNDCKNQNENRDPQSYIRKFTTQYERFKLIFYGLYLLVLDPANEDLENYCRIMKDFYDDEPFLPNDRYKCALLNKGAKLLIDISTVEIRDNRYIIEPKINEEVVAHSEALYNSGGLDRAACFFSGAAATGMVGYTILLGASIVAGSASLGVGFVVGGLLLAFAACINYYKAKEMSEASKSYTKTYRSIIEKRHAEAVKAKKGEAKLSNPDEVKVTSSI